MCPSIAYAHDEEILLLPLGQFCALVVVGLIIGRLAKTSAARAATLLSAVTIIAVCWFIPAGQLPTVAGNFILGLLPPIAIAILALALFRNFRQSKRGGP